MNQFQNGHSHSAASRPVLITGGCGFIGTNLALRLLHEGRRVTVFDNLSRRGVEDNLQALRAAGGAQLQLVQADVSDVQALRACVQEAGAIYHFAAQVAVTSSLDNPLLDFETNARGTLNLLEAWRHHSKGKVPLVFTSTNKVYGGLPDLQWRETATRYEPRDETVRHYGISETRLLDFHSPYGCSKGAADQYVIDYARTFGLPAVVFRMSCIYGPHQKGNEDQGWVAHFLLRALDELPITIYGDGKQVRDLLFVDDLVEALRLASQQAPRLAGRAFNIGGGPQNALSLREVLDIIGALRGAPQINFADWRPGDQKFYVSDTRQFTDATGWQPRMAARDGIEQLLLWLEDYRAAASTCSAENARLLPVGAEATI